MVQIYNNATVLGFVGSIESLDASAAQYQLTLEGYDNYTNQSVHINRAEQTNPIGNTRNGAGCAFATCGLYSSTDGLGVMNAGKLAVTAAANSVGSGLFVNMRDTGAATAVGMINTQCGGIGDRGRLMASMPDCREPIRFQY